MRQSAPLSRVVLVVVVVVFVVVVVVCRRQSTPLSRGLGCEPRSVQCSLIQFEMVIGHKIDTVADTVSFMLGSTFEENIMSFATKFINNNEHSNV